MVGTLLALGACGSEEAATGGEARTATRTETTTAAAEAEVANPPEDEARAADRPASRVTTRQNAGGSECRVSAPASLGSAARSAVAIAVGEGGGLVAFPSGRHTVAVQPIDSDGAARGDAGTLEVPQLTDELVLARIEGAYLSVSRGLCPDRDGTCVWAHALGEDGAPRGAPVTQEARGSGAWHEALRRASLADDTGDSLWLFWEVDTSHAGEGVDVQRFELDAEGRPRIGERRSARNTTGEHALMGALFAATHDHYASIFGTRGEVWSARDDDVRVMSQRWMVTDTTDVREVRGIGGAIRDLVLANNVIHVLWEERGQGFRAGRLDAAGQLVGEPTPVDARGPLPTPFTDRVLPRIVTGDDSGRVDFRRYDAASRRLSDPIPLPGPSDLAFDGRRFFVASVGRGGDRPVTVRTIDCTP